MTLQAEAPHLSRRRMGPEIAFKRDLLIADFQANGNDPPCMNEKKTMTKQTKKDKHLTI